MNRLDNEEEALEFIFSMIPHFSSKYENFFIQFLNSELVLNEEHIFKAIYFVQRAFQSKINISNSKSMEVLLYLSTRRQIKKSIDAFGVKLSHLKDGKITFILVSSNNKLDMINQEVTKKFGVKKSVITINESSIEKFNRIKGFYDISDNQIKSVLNSFGHLNFDVEPRNLKNLIQALHDIICEKMSLLSLEKIKIDKVF